MMERIQMKRREKGISARRDPYKISEGVEVRLCRRTGRWREEFNRTWFRSCTLLSSYRLKILGQSLNPHL